MASKEQPVLVIYWKDKNKNPKAAADGKKIMPIAFGETYDLVKMYATLWLEDNGIKFSQYRVIYMTATLVEGGKLINQILKGEWVETEYGTAWTLVENDSSKITTI